MSETEISVHDLERHYSFREALAAAPAPVVTFTLIAINVLIFLAMIAVAKPVFQISNQQMLQWGADFGPLTLNGQWWRIVSSCFLHFGFIHIGMNMFILFQVGVFTEKLYGNVRFLLLYLLAGIGGSLLSLYSHPLSVSAGASGAVFGVYGGLLAFLLVQRGTVPSAVSWNLAKSAGIFIAYNVVYGLASPSTDLQAHLGGLVSGFLLGCALARPLTADGQRIYPVRALLVGLLGVSAAYAAMTHLPSQQGEQAHWMQELLTDERVSAGKNNFVLYSGTAKKEEAQNLGEALKKAKYFNGSNGMAILTKGPQGTVISIPTSTKDPGPSTGGAGSASGRLVPYPWDDPHFIASVQSTGVQVENAVGGPPLQIAILSSDGKVEKLVPILWRRWMVGAADSVWYSGAVTTKQATELGIALRKVGLFRDTGMRAFLDRSDGLTRLSFSVKEGAWDDPKVVATFVQIGVRVLDAIGDPPVTITLMNADLERKKDMVIQGRVKSSAGLKMLPSGD